MQGQTIQPFTIHFLPATLRQWNRLPTRLSATTCPETFRASLRALTSALISSIDCVHHNNTFYKSPEVHTITLLTFFIYIFTICFKRAYTAPSPKRTNFVGLLTPCKGPVQYKDEEDYLRPLHHLATAVNHTRAWRHLAFTIENRSQTTMTAVMAATR